MPAFKVGRLFKYKKRNKFNKFNKYRCSTYMAIYFIFVLVLIERHILSEVHHLSRESG